MAVKNQKGRRRLYHALFPRMNTAHYLPLAITNRVNGDLQHMKAFH